MYCTRQISPDIHWVGGYDRRLELFENMFPLPWGVTYNSYLIMDEKVALIDTVDASISRQFLENIDHVLQGRTIDYLVINHMEPDHCASIEELLVRYPGMKLVGNKKTFQMLEQFYHIDVRESYYEIKEKDVLALGKHRLQFFFAQMVHWPEVMVAYEQSQRILFSADAFGAFGAFSGSLFSDEVDVSGVYMEEARRYYANIVGKYGAQVQGMIKKLAGTDIQMICPLHGLIWRKNLSAIIEKYDLWSRYMPEKNSVVCIYASMYGNTENAVHLLTEMLAERGITDVRSYDVSKTHASYIIADAFQCSHLVFACPTYNAGIYYAMDTLLHEMRGLNLQNRKIALIGNGSWAPTAGRLMRDFFAGMKNMTEVSPLFEMRSTVRPDQLDELKQLADDLRRSVKESE